MEQASTIIGIIGGVVTSVLLPLLGVFLFYDAKKRKAYSEAGKAEAETESLRAAEWRKLYEELKGEGQRLNDKIDQLYKEKEEDRKRIRELQEKNTALALERQTLLFMECRVRGCKDRQPPSDY